MDAILPLVSKYRMPLTVAWLVILLVWESAAPIFDYFRKQGRERVRHALRI